MGLYLLRMLSLYSAHGYPKTYCVLYSAVPAFFTEAKLKGKELVLKELCNRFLESKATFYHSPSRPPVILKDVS